MRGLTTLSMLGLAIALTAICPSSLAAPVPDGAIAAIDKIAAEGIDQKKVASYAVAVVKDGSLVLARGYGYSDLENDVPATAETVYRLGSITKQFTALAIMQLAEQGKLSVDDELTKFLPDYPTRRTQGHRQPSAQSHLGHQELHQASRLSSSVRGSISRTTSCWRSFKNEPFDFEPGVKWALQQLGLLPVGHDHRKGQRTELSTVS